MNRYTNLISISAFSADGMIDSQDNGTDLRTPRTVVFEKGQTSGEQEDTHKRESLVYSALVLIF